MHLRARGLISGPLAPARAVGGGPTTHRRGWQPARAPLLKLRASAKVKDVDTIVERLLGVVHDSNITYGHHPPQVRPCLIQIQMARSARFCPITRPLHPCGRACKYPNPRVTLKFMAWFAFGVDRSHAATALVFVRHMLLSERERSSRSPHAGCKLVLRWWPTYRLCLFINLITLHRSSQCVARRLCLFASHSAILRCLLHCNAALS